MRTRLLLTVYGLILVGELMWSAMVPLVPEFADELQLSTLETGILVSGTGAAVLVCAMPSGILADRVGARRVAVGSSLFLALGLAGHALPPTFGGLFLSRVLFGVGFAALWTAGVSYAGDLVAPEKRARALSLNMTIAGTAFMLGPALAGVVAARTGPRLPFAVGAVVVAVLGACLAFGPGPASVANGREPITARRLRAATRVQVGLASNFVAGFISAAIFLLVPLQLADQGLGSASIGIALTLSAVAFTLASAGVARVSAAAASAAVAGLATLGLAATMALPLLGVTVASLVALLMLRAPVSAVLYGISYPLSADGADEAGLGRGAILGLLNMTWAAAAVIGPILCGAIAQFLGDRPVYGAIAGVCLLFGPWMLACRRRVPALTAPAAA